jgi:hypothetical protein
MPAPSPVLSTLPGRAWAALARVLRLTVTVTPYGYSNACRGGQARRAGPLVVALGQVPGLVTRALCAMGGTQGLGGLPQGWTWAMPRLDGSSPKAFGQRTKNHYAC